MSWENTQLSEVVESAKTPFTPIPEGTYKLRLLGVKPDTYRPTDLAMDFQIAEGQYAGRRIFPTLPDPSVKSWALNAAKKLADALGVTQDTANGETIPAMLNRAASNGHAVVSAQVTVETYLSKKESTPDNPVYKQNNKVSLFSFEATA